MLFRSIGYEPVLLDAIKSTNTNQVFVVMDLIRTSLGRLQGKKITILGLSFKENTDDIRESVSINLIKLLLEQKCKITVHDPRAIDNTRSIFGSKITYHCSVRDSLKDSDCSIIMTPWKEYKKIDEVDLRLMKKPLVIDTRRILKIKDKKINYIGLGIGT